MVIHTLGRLEWIRKSREHDWRWEGVRVVSTVGHRVGGGRSRE